MLVPKRPVRFAEEDRKRYRSYRLDSAGIKSAERQGLLEIAAELAVTGGSEYTSSAKPNSPSPPRKYGLIDRFNDAEAKRKAQKEKAAEPQPVENEEEDGDKHKLSGSESRKLIEKLSQPRRIPKPPPVRKGPEPKEPPKRRTDEAFSKHFYETVVAHKAATHDSLTNKYLKKSEVRALSADAGKNRGKKGGGHSAPFVVSTEEMDQFVTRMYESDIRRRDLQHQALSKKYLKSRESFAPKLCTSRPVTTRHQQRSAKKEQGERRASGGDQHQQQHEEGEEAEAAQEQNPSLPHSLPQNEGEERKEEPNESS